ncbi:hypothetical protein GCM10010360_40050 [Streptomyces nogalater]
MTTIGVEEEYLLVGPVAGLPASGGQVAAGLGRLGADQEVRCELLRAQAEVATQVVRDSGGDVGRWRSRMLCGCHPPSAWE